ncbi:melanocyte-stimulating hormone receptor-like [Haliotis rubra]|uniref:melanocyte-stimulating hormone receptor-like n=1 Tax=Haliotis rubra TaxID=36100 RepID=UPI001EE5DA2E|nr:melanocyte-stimulating hormone receptor-like [Haliotis rubra]
MNSTGGENTMTMNATGNENTTTLMITFCVLVFMISLLSLVGNILVLAAIIRSRRLHTTSNVYVCALAVTDIFITVVHAVKYTLRALEVNLSFIPCCVIVGMSLLGCSTNLMLIEAISVDRFYAIYWPFKYRKKCTKSRAIKLCVFIMIFSFASESVLVMIFHSKTLQTTCWSEEILTAPIATTFTIVICCVALELTVMYGAMFYKAVEHQRNLSIGYFSKNKDLSIFDIKALKTCSVVLGAFLIMWFPPLSMFNVIAYSSSPSDYDLALLACMVFPVVNTAVDPVVYAIMRKDIKKGIRRLFRRLERQPTTIEHCELSIKKAITGCSGDQKGSQPSLNSVSEASRMQLQVVQETRKAANHQ